MKKTMFILMLLTIMSKVLGFTRDLVLSYFYGASSISDVYLISLTIPTIIFAIIGQAISTGYIPMYTRINKEFNSERALHYTNNIVNVMLVLCTIIILLGIIFTMPIVKLFASGFEGETLELAISFTRISLLGVYFTSLIYILSGYLDIKGLFIIPAIIGLPANIIMIASIYFSSITNLYILCVGSLLAVFSQFLLVFIYSHKNKYSYKPILDLKDQNIRKMLYIALPAILGTSVTQINLLVNRSLASTIAEGGIAALTYASTLSGFIQGIFVSTITTVLYPKISRLAVDNRLREIKSILTGAIISVNILVVPATIGFMFYSKPVVELLFGRGNFDAEAINMTSSSLFFLAIGMVGIGLRGILSNVFYAFQDTKTPMINAAIAMLINIILNFILSDFLGVGGLALATSLSAIICSLLLMFNLRNKIGSFGIRKLVITSVKILVVSLVMGLLSKAAYMYLVNYISQPYSLVIAVVLAVIVYFPMIYYLRISEVNIFIEELKKKVADQFNKKDSDSL